MDFRILFSLLFLLATTTSQAVPVAIIDSGTDFDHPDLKPYAWVNPGDSSDDGADNEHNGMEDDVHGWNFAENNKKLIERQFLGKFSGDVYKYFEVQLRMFEGTITEEDKNWVKSKKSDPKFLEEMQLFGNFMHGTHVAGIASKDAPMNQIMGVKLLPTQVRKQGGSKAVLDWAQKFRFPVKELQDKVNAGSDSKVTDFIIKTGLKTLAGAQSEMLIPVGRYMRLSGAKVANCSFGVSPIVIKMLLGQLFKAIMKKDMPEEQLNHYAAFFMKTLADQGRKFSVIANKTFFVIAAGNDGSDNDIAPAYPAGIRRFNAITVAATHGLSKLAVFSNYGKESVEVAAPGVGILSAEPGTGHIRVSGTSQAAPFVTNIAGRILDQNPALEMAEVKKILMETVDFKDFLKDKVVAGGIVNPMRATIAAQMSRSMDLGQAIATARFEVADAIDPNPAPAASTAKVEALELPMPQFIRYE